MASTPLPRSTPEAQGVSSADLLRLIDTLHNDIHDMHSIMVMRHGHVIAEGWWAPYGPQHAHVMFSLSKSFTSTAIGLLVNEGRLSLRDKVTALFPDDLPEQINPHLAAMTVHDLLSMNTGHETESQMWGQHNWARSFLAHPPTHAPGTRFLYNTPATYMCSAIVQQITGQKLIDYLRPRLFEPLGIDNPTWDECPRGYNTGGFGLNITTEDIAKFGQLYLQNGLWQGRQLVPAAYVAEATRKQVRNDLTPINDNIDWQQGYGYQFWRCRHDCYRGDGAFGQYCVVLPARDAVVAITSGVQDMQSVLNVLWDKLLPAFQPGPLAANPAAHAALGARTQHLSIPTVAGQFNNNAAQHANGSYRLEPNASGATQMLLQFGQDEDTITITDAQGAKTFAVGHGRWAHSPAPMRSGGNILGGPLSDVYSSGAWQDENTYTFRAYFRATPFSWMGTLKLAGERAELALRAHVHFAWHSPEIASLSGHKIV